MATAEIDTALPPVTLQLGNDVLSEGSGGTYEHVNPCTGAVDSIIPMAGVLEMDQAVAYAHEAFLRWQRTKPAERRRLLLRLADLMDANKEEFVRRGALDNGAPVATLRQFFPLASEWTRYYAGFADKLSGRVASTFDVDGEFSYEIPQPYGVIGVILPSNGALLSLAMKVPAALAAGNTVVVKPAEQTPFASELFGQLVKEAGFPSGVFNLLPGTAQAAARMVEHPLVKKITFTGGPVTGSKILTACAKQMKPAVMELGGKSANLIFADADIEAAVKWGASRVLGTLAGQTCASPSRMLVEQSVYDEVVERVVKFAGSIVIGNALDETTIMGPVISADSVERILGMTERAQQEGATLVLGGKRPSDQKLAQGFFVEPTVLTNVDPRSEIAQTEIFGPVLSIMPFSSEERAIEIANGTEYALASYIQTSDVRRAHRVAERLAAGVTLINGAGSLMPNRSFGGFDLSGYGREGGPEGLHEFLRTKTVAMI